LVLYFPVERCFEKSGQGQISEHPTRLLCSWKFQVQKYNNVS
jgi:hypothetical protein